ncbi:MAG: hypothetical protein ACUVSX_01160 [Aggregatilineales bacterium]
MITLLIHIANAEPIKLDVDELPKPTDLVIVGSNPRDRKDREVSWVEDGVNTVILPWSRINYIEILPDKEAQEEFPLPFRND